MRAFARPLPAVQGDLQGRTRQPRRGKKNGDDAVAPPVFFSHSMGDVVVARQVRFSSLSSAPSPSSSAMASEGWHAQIRALLSRARARAFPRENKKREQRPLSLSLFPSFSKPRPRRGKKVKGRSHFPSRSTVARMLQRNAVFLPSSVPLRTGLSTHTHPHASALCSPKTAAAAMNEPKRAKLGSSRNAIDPTSASTCAAAAAASLTGDGGAAAARSAASAAPPSSRPAPVCLSHEIVDSFNVPGESE